MITNINQLSIIIVNYNTRQLLKNCLESINLFLSKENTFDVWVIDNNSSDDSKTMLVEYQKCHSWLHIEFLPSNTGFAYANNVGIKASKSEYVLLLNSDTYLIDSSINKAIRYLSNHKEVFGCGCCLLDGNQKPGVSFGKFPTLWTVCLEIATNQFTGLRAQIPDMSNGVVFDIDYPCGAFFLINREHMNSIGLLDESFFMYFEETDLAFRAKKGGKTVKLLTDVSVVHLGARSSQSREKEQKQLIIFYNSWQKYYKKNHGAILTIILKSILKAFFCIRSQLKLFPSWEHYKLHQKALMDGWK